MLNELFEPHKPRDIAEYQARRSSVNGSRIGPRFWNPMLESCHLIIMRKVQTKSYHRQSEDLLLKVNETSRTFHEVPNIGLNLQVTGLKDDHKLNARTARQPDLNVIEVYFDAIWR